MFKSSKRSNTFWTSIVYPNKYPAFTIPNYSLAKSANTLSIWIPTHAPHTNVNYVFKEEPKKSLRGEDLGHDKNLISEMKGKGKLSAVEEALQHPFKVKVTINE